MAPEPDGIGIRRDRCIARRAARSWGVLSVEDLLDCGLTHDAIMRRARRGILTRLHRGVYAVGHASPPPEGALLAAAKACGKGALVSHASAAWLWGLLERLSARPEVTVPGSSACLHRGIRAHRSARIDPADRGHKRGVRVTSPARTLLDLAGRFSHRELRRAVRQAQSLRLVSVRDLLTAIERLGPRPGTRKLAEILATGPAPTRSELEDVVLELLLGGGFITPMSIDRCFSPGVAWSRISGGPSRRSSSRPTAAPGTTTPPPGRTMRSAKPCSRHTVTVSCG